MKIKGRVITFIAVLLSAIMLFGATTSTPILNYAVEANSVTAVAEEKEEQNMNKRVEVMMGNRTPVTADRSAMTADNEAGVYVNGKLVFTGSFTKAWEYAIKTRAPSSVKNGKALEDYELEKLDVVEFVLNKNWIYDGTKMDKPGFNSGSLMIKGKKVTVDLNGCVISRTDGFKYSNRPIFNVEGHAELTIIDSNPYAEHRGTLYDTGLWTYNGTGNDIIKGGIITCGLDRSSTSKAIATALFIWDSTVKFYGGTIAGIRNREWTAVNMGGDGAVFDMSQGVSQICYNVNKDVGAAIKVTSGDSCIIKGGYIHNNISKHVGGAVYCCAYTKNTQIIDTVFYANKSTGDGGAVGIYPYTNVTLNGCTIVGNYAGNRGGGIATRDEGTTIIDCHIEGNCSKEHGGGVYVQDSDGAKVKVAGKTIIRKNYKSSESKMSTATDNSNLYLQGDKSLIPGDLSIGAEIWIRTGTSADKYNGTGKRLTAEKTGVSELHFFADNTKYYVAYQNDPTKSNYRHLYFAKGTRTLQETKVLDDFAPVELDTKYKVETGANAGKQYPLYRGTVEFNLMTTSDFSSASPFYYSDGYFFEDAKTYNKHLATMSANMAVAAFGRGTEAVGDNNYANHFANVKQLMADIGCKDEHFFANQDYQMKPEYFGKQDRLSTIAVAMSQKKISDGDKNYTLVPIAIRGGSYEVEWASNVTIGNRGEAKGFLDAANQVFNHVQKYLYNYGLTTEASEGRVKFWVVGYSRAGATANLTSKMLVDYYSSIGNETFGYTFEAPMGGVESAKHKNTYTDNGEYKTIHNTVNENDFVTLVAPSEMGFIRYGTDHLIGSDFKNNNKVNSGKNEYYNQRMKMVKQLAAINPYYNFDDSWEIAQINLILSRLPIIGTEVIDKGDSWFDSPDDECRNMYQFLRWFFEHVQYDGLLKENGHHAGEYELRDYYSKEPILKNISGNKPTYNLKYTDKKYNFAYTEMSIQEAVCGLMVLVQGMPSSQMDELVEVVLGNLNSNISSGVKFIKQVFSLYMRALKNWSSESNSKRLGLINEVCHMLLNTSRRTDKTIWDILDDEQEKILVNGLPIILWFALSFASEDYNDGMWGVGTFINNMDAIISNHYQEVTVAWVRSYDSYYENDTQSYKIVRGETEKPKGTFNKSSKRLELSAESGSSIFYTTDNGESWTLYTKPVTLGENVNKVSAFSVSRGVKSDDYEVPDGSLVGALFASGNIWFIIAGAIAIIVGTVVVVEVNKKQKNKAE